MTAISWLASASGTLGYWTDSADWSTGTVPGAGDDVTISAAPATAGVPYTVVIDEDDVTVHSGTLDQAEATLDLYFATLTVSTTFALTAGTLELAYGATLQGGTYSGTGGTVLLGGYSDDSQISGVTWEGTLNLSGGVFSTPGSYYSSSVTLNDLAFAGAGATMALGEGVEADFYGTQTLNTVTVDLAYGSEIYANGALTLASKTDVVATSSASLYSSANTGTTAMLLNQGTISATGSGTVLTVDAQGSFANSGVVSVSNGASLLLDIATGSNSGQFAIAAGGFLELDVGTANGFTGSGSVVDNGGTLCLDYSLTTSQLASFPVKSGTLAVAGTLTNTGTTLASGAGTKIANFQLDGGTIIGGTIASNGNFAVASNSTGETFSTVNAGTLSGVTFRGALGVSAYTSLTIAGGITFAGIGSAAAATVSIAAGAVAEVSSSATFNAAAVALGGALTFGTSGEAKATTLTLGSKLSLTQTAAGASIDAETSADMLVNAGTITASDTGSYFYIDAPLLNSGTIAISNGATLDISQYDYAASTLNLTNTGTIKDTGGLLECGTLTSKGLISLSGTTANLGFVSLINSGTLSLSNGVFSLGGDNESFSNTGTLLISAATVTLGGTLSGIGTAKISNGGVLGISDGTLTNSGTLHVGTGTALAALSLETGGVISGGTIADAGGGIVVANGTLSGVTYDGKINLSGAGAQLTITGGITMAGIEGTGTGTILATGSQSGLTFIGSETISNAVIDFGSTSGYEAAISIFGQLSPATLTLASGASLVETGSFGDISGSETYNSTQGTYGLSGDVFVNDGTITDALQGGDLALTLALYQNNGNIGFSAGAALDLGSSTLTNAGTLSLSGGSYLEFSSYGLESSVTNAGLFSIGTGSDIVINSNEVSFANSGTVAVAGGTLSLDGSFSVAGLGSVVLSNGGKLTIDADATLGNTGATLSLGTGAAIGSLTLAGTITGGAIHDAGGGILAAGGTLSGVAYAGALSLSGYEASLTLTGGTTIAAASGSGPGTISVTGEDSDLRLLGSQTIANDVIELGASNDYNADVSIADSGGPSTITLAAGSSVLVTGEYAGISGSVTYSSAQGTDGLTGDVFVNNGTIADSVADSYFGLEAAIYDNNGSINVTGGATLQIDSGTLVNAGTLSLSGGAGLQVYAGFDDISAGFTNTGLVTIGAGTYAYLDSGEVTLANSGTIALAGGTLSLAGSFTVAELGSVAVSNGGGILIDVDSILDNTGTTLSVGAATALGTLAVEGTILGGTIADAGGGLSFIEVYNYQFGTYSYGGLDAVTYEGVLAVSSDDTVVITGGIALTGASGSGAGSINLTALYSELDFASTETLNSVTVSIGSAYGGSTLSAYSSSGYTTLTLGKFVTIKQAGAAVTLNASNGMIDNTAKLAFATAGGTLTLAGDFDNGGTIAVSNGETLVLDTTTLTNTGVITVTNSLLAIGNGSAAQLASIQLINSDLAVTGVLTETGSTLKVGTGTSMPVIKLQGTILGGTIDDAGNGVQFNGYAVLDGVTYNGTVDINRPLSALAAFDGLTLDSVTGSQPGSVVLTGAGSTLAWGGIEALDNATVSIGNAGLTYEGHAVAAPALAAYAGYDFETGLFLSTPVTLGAHLTIQQTGTYADIGGQYDNYGGIGPDSYYFDTTSGTFGSAATIEASFAGGRLSLEGASFSTTGAIAISNTATVTAAAAMTLNGGLISIGAGSALNLDLYNYFADSSLADESFANSGSIVLGGGSIDELTDAGTFLAVPMLNAAGASITGYGMIAAPVLNDGMIEAIGGTLTVAQAVSGSGTLAVGASATLDLSAVSNGETASFAGAAGVLGLSPPTFLGSIGGFVSGDIIDLANTSAKAAAFSGTSLIVTLTNGGTIALSMTSALTGSLTVTAGSAGDSLIGFAHAAKHASPIPQRAVQDEMRSLNATHLAWDSAAASNVLPPQHSPWHG
jgi:hypothetical protein